MEKFTQEIKNKWLKALKSGEYTQCKVDLEKVDYDGKKSHCCIGVLGCILGLNNKSNEPYDFLLENIGYNKLTEIWRLNDKTFNKNKRDYSNVIPLIKTLEVK